MTSRFVAPAAQRGEMHRGQLIGLLFLISALGLGLSWWNYDRFTAELALDPLIDQEPRQESIERPAFEVEANEVVYRVQPLYRYELTGLVVSFKRFSRTYGLHKRWNDFINIADLCVVWGSNAREVPLDRFSFWNGEFTCNFRTGDPEAWDVFDPNRLSNNHLLTRDDYLSDQLDRVQVGDQIVMRGWLAEYGEPGKHVRGTSTTRTDRGNGACETVYLEDFAILGSMQTNWRRLWWPSVLGLFAALVLWLATPQRHMRKY